MDVGPISEANIKTWHFLNGRLRVGGESAKLADIANQKFDRADIGPIKCVTWAGKKRSALEHQQHSDG